MLEEVFRHLLAEGLLAEVAGDFFGAVLPKDYALLAINEVDADREAQQDGAMDFRVVDHGAFTLFGASDLPGDAARARIPMRNRSFEGFPR